MRLEVEYSTESPGGKDCANTVASCESVATTVQLNHWCVVSLRTRNMIPRGRTLSQVMLFIYIQQIHC